jgi:hypothetical protein
MAYPKDPPSQVSSTPTLRTLLLVLHAYDVSRALLHLYEVQTQKLHLPTFAIFFQHLRSPKSSVDVTAAFFLSETDSVVSG